MSKTFRGDIVFPTNFDVQVTKPLDARLVVDSYEDLTNGSIEAPYQGMVVNIKGTSELWILKTSGIDNSHNPDNWELVTGSSTGDGNGLSKYSLPVMTQEMADEATLDPDVDFDGSEDPYILVGDPYESAESNKDMYLSLISDMARAIKALQAEVTRLKNTFEYGIDSYTDERTAKSRVLGELTDTEAEEPFWSLDPDVGLIMVPDSIIFNTVLDTNHTFQPIGKDRDAIDVSIDGQLTFNDCKGVFYDGNAENAPEDNLTLWKLTDSKLVTYLVTDKPNIKVTLISLNDKSTKEIDLSSFVAPNLVRKYGFCIILSRKVKDNVEDIYNGFNYIHISIINYDTSRVLVSGYLASNGTLVDGHLNDDRHLVGNNGEEIELNHRYSIKSIEFDRLTLSRMKFYTKFEDFSEEVIPYVPEDDFKYEVAHIAIRSVKNKEMLDSIADQLKDNELIWNKSSSILYIKSEGKLYAIGSKSVNPDDEHNNNDNNMTDREIIQALEKMGVIVNVEYLLDEEGNETDEINPESLSRISMADISDVTFINEDTNRRFTFTVDPEGNLVGKDKSAQTIDEFLGSAANGYKNPSDTYKAVRGFAADYLLRKNNGSNTNLNKQGDLFKLSDRLRISSFYAPISTDERHGCTHSFIELENSSSIDIPLTGIYLHFFNPAENTYTVTNGVISLTSDVVHHLALDGVIKAGGTYLIRGAKHAEFDDESAFIKVKTFDKEWYENGQLISFEQKPGKAEISEDGSTVPSGYRFCLTYGLEDLSANKKLVDLNSDVTTIGTADYDSNDYPNLIIDPRFIDSCSFSTLAAHSKNESIPKNLWYANGSKGAGITIKANTMFRLTFALDPAKQAFNGFNGKDSSRIRYNKGTDIQILNLDKEYIGFPNSKETIKIEQFTPKASFENRNVMTDKTQLNREKPNMVTCSLGVDVYNTRCFNWISCGAFDEYLWIRKKRTNEETEYPWVSFQSYKKNDSGSVPNLSDNKKINISIDYTGKVTMSADGNPSLYYTTDGNDPDGLSPTYSEPFTVPLGTTITVMAVIDNSTQKATATYDWRALQKKTYPTIVNNTVYARMINRFPGNDVLFTAHKCVIELPEVNEETVFEYVVGRADKDGKPDVDHTNSVFTFTMYPRTYEGRLYQVTDQQGFHWIEYQVWAAAAEFLNKKIADECKEINDAADAYNTANATAIENHTKTAKVKVFPILLNTGDMTQSGARINEWLDYYNGGICLFDHLEQMNCVGNNDLCPNDPRDLGTGNDSDKASSHFFHYFYCFDVMDKDMYNSASEDDKKFFSGETLIVKPHQGSAIVDDKTININVTENKYIPSLYYFKTKDVMYVIINSEIPTSNCQNWFGLCSDNQKLVSIYTGIEISKNGSYINTDYFTPVYETLYAWFKSNQDNQNKPIKKVVVAMHEMPFTVITKDSLANNDKTKIPRTRNNPITKARVGSNTNQLDVNENKGIYWCSRLLEYFGCKIVIGGHKHTYALSYPIKEKYSWTYTDTEHPISGIETNHKYDSKDKIKPMSATLADEAGSTQTYSISWDIDLAETSVEDETKTNKEVYKIDSTIVVSGENKTTLSSTKTPYIPKNMYDEIGLTTFGQSDSLVRCCTPLTVSNYSDGKYDGFVTYSMCQATGYKLKSNKELPSIYQMFSRIIPKTKHGSSSDNPSGNQLYPMYSVLEFNNDCSELDITMNRITGIFVIDGDDDNTDGADTFNQTSYGNRPLGVQMLCTGTDVAIAKRMYGIWVDKDTFNTRDINSRYLHIKF